MTTSLTRAVLLVVCLIIASAGVSAAVESPSITNVKVAHDLRTVTIFGDQDLGRHHAFVIKDPYRLVIDFESTGLGRVPRKIRINRDGLNEIRLGVSASKARVVVDFGEAEVPPYTIRRRDKKLVLFLSGVPRAKSENRGRITDKPKDKARPRAKKSQKHAPKSKNKSSLAIRSAGVTGKMVFLELADRKNPKRHYRFVMEVDEKTFQPGQLSMSDSEGRVECFRVMPASPNIASGAKDRGGEGATKAEASASQDYTRDEGKFPWGRKEIKKQEAREATTKKPKSAPGVTVRIRKPGPSNDG